MRNRLSSWLLAGACLSLCMQAALAQKVVSAGRGAPDPLRVSVMVGPDGRGYTDGPGTPPEGFKPVVAAMNGATPPGVQALPRDLFTSDDFYIDKE
ncbi:MAG TPA: hypothetical protein VMH83_05370, partial [Candidatus Acidoferrum sp.]|nr:hypothetical protein [Candidatus Acidoferrum sp.]